MDVTMVSSNHMLSHSIIYHCDIKTSSANWFSMKLFPPATHISVRKTTVYVLGKEEIYIVLSFALTHICIP